MDVINAKSNTYPFVEVVIYSEILRTNCRMNQSSSHLAMVGSDEHFIDYLLFLSQNVYYSYVFCSDNRNEHCFV